MREGSKPAVAHYAIAALFGLTLLAGCRVEQKPPPKAEASTEAPAAPAAVAPAPAAPAAATAGQSAPAVEPSKPAPAAALPAPTGIGRIDSLEGTVRVVRSAGERPGEAGLAFDEGDTVIAGPDAWALLVMNDGASITLRSDSELRFENYRYSAERPSSANTALMSLQRGALRSITGEIGKINPAGYEVKTPGATIAVKGTDHEPAYYPPAPAGEKPAQTPGTYDKVNAGESVIRSAERTIPARPGQIVYVHDDPKARPQLLAREPAFYQRHAEADKRVEVRRAEFHRTFEQERRKRARVQKQQIRRQGDGAEQRLQQGATPRASAASDAPAEKKAQAESAETKAQAKDEKKAAAGNAARKGNEKKAFRKDVPPAGAERSRRQRGDKAGSRGRQEASR